jgi:hypothetical protein
MLMNGKYSLVPMLCVGMQLRGSASTIPGGRTSKMAFPVWKLGTRKEVFGQVIIPQAVYLVN